MDSKNNWREAHKGLTDQIRSARDGGYSGQTSGGTHPSGHSSASPTVGAQQTNLVPCKNCGRTFNADRVQVHERICVRTGKRKTRQFNSFKQRISGTGAENYLKRGRPSDPPKKLQGNNWRKQHQDFINSIQYARGTDKQGTSGGSHPPPPPPPLDTSDYIQCPHCGRKFNETAAARHIPACATMIHNKPKPNTPKK